MANVASEAKFNVDPSVIRGVFTGSDEAKFFNPLLGNLQIIRNFPIRVKFKIKEKLQLSEKIAWEITAKF